MSELKDWNAEGARHLALRDKAVAPIGNMQEGAHAYGQRLLANTAFRNAAHEMADTIAGLLAENERAQEWKKLFFSTAKATTDGLLTYVEAHKAALTRAEAAETRLRELCEMEPVASIVNWITSPGDLAWGAHDGGLPLIPRPSMPESGK